MRHGHECHELPASRIMTIRVAARHVCDYANYRGHLYPDRCQKCNYPCVYGMRLLELLNLEKEPVQKDFGIKPYPDGQMLPTLRQRIRKRKK